MLLGAVVAFHAVDRDGRADTVSMETPAQVRDPEKTAADLALLPTAHDGRLKSMDEVTAARVRIEDLKKKLKVWNTDFARMKHDLEQRLDRAPDGKITPEEVLAVIPPEYREEFKSVITSMYTEQIEPMTMKETRP
jgi:hypothetical protein